MKRLIKYYNKFNNDGLSFSGSSTVFEVLPVLVDDSADMNDLIKLSKKLGYKRTAKKYQAKPLKYRRSNQITHAVALQETKKSNYRDDDDHRYFLGFITIDTSGTLTPVIKDGIITEQQAYDIRDNQEYGVSDSGEHVDGQYILIKSGWNFYSDMRLLGYNHTQFLELIGADDYGFYDDTYLCHSCGKFDDTDNGHTYNHRHTDDSLLGVNCGCYEEYCEDNFESHFGDNHSEAIELSTAEKLESDNKIEHIERFIGGMTDGRGGWYDGESCREGNPETILKEFKEKYPNDTFIFSHDESGQFQTYFSIWRVKA